MALIDEIKTVCDRLAPLGWRDLLLTVTNQALDIAQPTATQLHTALTTPLTNINRDRLLGFADFARAGNQGITPGKPSHSLLYHALASPYVVRDAAGNTLRGFPTLQEIETVENYVFAVQPPTLTQIVQQQGGANNVAIVIFASEYRPAKDTVDGQHADLTFSRTGIARVGTARPRYNPETRGFWPEDEDNPHNFRVIPCRYSAWLAVKKKGKDVRISPILDATGQISREPARDFWVPVHKLFAGNECLQGFDLTPRLVAKLFNLKIQRIHKALRTTPLPSGYPYVIEGKEIADWSAVPDFGSGWLVPTVHSSLTEPAIVDGKRITFRVPENGRRAFGALEFASAAPEYVHVRTAVEGDNHTIDLNDQDDVLTIVNRGGYLAQHYVDFTGEGWVSVEVPQINTLAVVAAYALVAAPDFFPSSGQFELSQWSRSSAVPASFRGKIWLASVPPTPLSETRVPANLQLPGNPFNKSDDSITAMVAMGPPIAVPVTRSPQPDVMRSSTLSDDAAGFFAPGWDVGVDTNENGAAHLAGYRLGSPFPEDAKLCAALSTFWPAVAPDVFRTFATPIGNTSGTVAPLTDDEIGQSGALPWDGIRGPSIVTENGQRFVVVHDFIKADYVQQTVENRFTQRLLARVSADEYKARILAICRVYSVVGNLGDIQITRQNWLALSFREVVTGDQELQRAQTDAGTILVGKVYRVDLCRFVPGAQRTPVPGMPRLNRFPLSDLRSFFASPSSLSVLATRETNSKWAALPSEPVH